MVQSLVFVESSSFLSVQQLALNIVGIKEMVFVPYARHSCICSFRSNLLLPSCVCIYCVFVQLLMVPINAPLFVFGMVPSLFLVSPLRGCHRRKHSRRPKCSAHRMEISVYKCVYYVALAACHLSLGALVATEEMPSQIRWQPLPGHLFLALSKQTTAISSKSLEVSPPVFDHDHDSVIHFDCFEDATSTNWHTARWLAAAAGMEGKRCRKMVTM